MWPWGHLAVGYLVYVGYLWARHRETPRGWPVLTLAVGTQFPDLVDKPLAYWFNVLPVGRSLTHSYLVAVPLSLGLVLVARRYGVGRAGIAFALGYLTHPFADGLAAILNGQFWALSFMVWPILPPPAYVAEDFGHHWLSLLLLFRRLSLERVLTDWGNPFVQQIWLGVLVFTLWVVHGMPPLGSALERLLRSQWGRRG